MLTVTDSIFPLRGEARMDKQGVNGLLGQRGNEIEKVSNHCSIIIKTLKRAI